MRKWLRRCRTWLATFGQPMTPGYRMTYAVPRIVYADEHHPGRRVWERRAVAMAVDRIHPEELADVKVTWQLAGPNAPSGFVKDEPVIVVEGRLR